MQPPIEQAATKDRVAFRFRPGLMERIKRAADADARTATSWVEKAILDALEAEDRKRRH